MGVGDCQMVSGGVSTNHVGGAAQFLFCRNTTSRYFLPVKLLENFTIMSPPNNSTSKIQKIQQYSSEWDAEGVVPYNPEFTANPEHGRTVFAPTDLLPWGSCFSRLYSIFKLQTRCRKCFSVRSEPLIVFT